MTRTYKEISLIFVDMSSDILTNTIIVIRNIRTKINTGFLHAFVLYLHVNNHMPYFNYLVATAIKPKFKFTFLFTTASRMALGPTLSNGYRGLFPWG
jgi:hypothetical protein